MSILELDNIQPNIQEIYFYLDQNKTIPLHTNTYLLNYLGQTWKMYYINKKDDMTDYDYSLNRNKSTHNWQMSNEYIQKCETDTPISFIAKINKNITKSPTNTPRIVSDATQKEINNEIQILKKLEKKKTCSLMYVQTEIKEDGKSTWMRMSTLGSLQPLYESKDEYFKIKFVKQVIKSLICFWKINKLLYVDLKFENLMFLCKKQKLYVKFIDFGGFYDPNVDSKTYFMDVSGKFTYIPISAHIYDIQNKGKGPYDVDEYFILWCLLMLILYLFGNQENYKTIINKYIEYTFNKITFESRRFTDDDEKWYNIKNMGEFINIIKRAIASIDVKYKHLKCILNNILIYGTLQRIKNISGVDLITDDLIKTDISFLKLDTLEELLIEITKVEHEIKYPSS